MVPGIYILLPMYREMGAYVQCKWRDVCVGDFVELECDEFIPADLLLLATSDPHYICYIETANIDGETNLKQRVVVPGIVDNLTPLVSTRSHVYDKKRMQVYLSGENQPVFDQPFLFQYITH